MITSLVFLELSQRQWAPFQNNSKCGPFVGERGRHSPIFISGSRPIRWPGKFFYPSAYAFIFADSNHYSVKLVPVS